MSDYVLGLDLGANSIGWALIDEANRKIIDCGVRVFPEGVNQFDTKKEKSKSEDRRVVRGMRRQIARRARRKRALRRALTAAGLLPTNEADQAAVDGLDPFVLRRRGLTERLTPHELGRALMHLNQRRGFLSNRKADRQQKDDTKGMLAEINELQKVIQDSGCETLGEFLAKELEADPLRRIRGRHTRRDMLETEFELLWERQRKHHPELLTDALKYGERGKLPGVREPLPIAKGKSPLAAYGVHGLIFFQRPMYWPKSVVGQCELEPRRKRCPRADRLAQRFRLLQEVNNLKYLDPGTKDELLLSQEQRTLLLALLSKTKEMTFDTIRKKLGFLESIPFNLERGNRSKLLGTPVDALLANKEIFGKEWHDRPEDEKTQIVRCLIHGDEGEIRRRAQAEWGLDEAATERLLNVDLPAGYSMLSIAALEKLVPHMERGLLYMTDDNTPCALLAAGYLRADQLRRQAKDQLPSPPDVANPVVRRALSELRKVVNSIIGRYGKPSAIRLEFARNATVSKEQRQEMSKRMRDREAERDGAASRLRDEYGEKVTRDKIDQYLLWEEQGKVCIYSGRPIDVSHLLGGEVHIDHILPRSRSLDNSFSNKVLCFIKHNADKKNRTPYEWLAGSDPERYDQVCQRAARLLYNKRRRFTQKELDLGSFIERQLNDTRYICRVALEYLRLLFAEPYHVLCPKGSHTGTFRWLWALNSVLREDSVDRKNRSDHRHHAIDAIVIALTDHRRLQALSQAQDYNAEAVSGAKLDPPWEGFLKEVTARVEQIVVSHRVQRKVAGALHEDTLYGPTEKPGQFVLRKPLEALTPAMVEEIRDAEIRRIVIARLAQFGISYGRGAKGSIPAEVWKEPLMMPGPKGAQIKRVRLLKADKTIRPIREGSAWVKPGNLHHLCLFEWEEKGKTVRDAVFVSMLEAIDRVKQRQPIIQRTHPERPNARFVMSLSSGETVLLPEGAVDVPYTFETAASTSKQMWFRRHTAGGKSSDKSGVVSKKPSSFDGRKITVTPLGEIRWAND